MKEAAVVRLVIDFVRSKHKHQTGHDYAHVLEVCRWALEIGSKIKQPVDPFIVLCGALLHDIGRIGASDGSFHGVDGGARTREFLDAVMEDQEMVARITGLVVRHTPTSGIPPRTDEEKVVCDADGLDRLGLMGMFRGIMNRKGSMEFIIKDRIKTRLQDFDKLYFPESRELAEPFYKETLRIVELLEKALDRRLLNLEQIESLKLIHQEF